MSTHALLALCVLLSAAAAPLQAAAAAHPPTATRSTIADHYALEDLAMPPGLDSQVGALAMTPSGKLVACFHRGEVLIYDPALKQWHPFAFGLHEPLGVIAVSDRELLIMQRPELTRVIDSDGDGVADRYETVSDQFGMTGNYHEFAFGPVQDKDGNCFISLNVASQGAGIFTELRGTYGQLGVSREDADTHWDKAKSKIGRMYSAVPYRGWVLKIDAKTGAVTPWACGFRSPDGLGFDAAGHLLVTDNQGDWLGSSKLFTVVKGGFYGHPASLVWRPEWKLGDPLALPVAKLDELRTRETMFFPQTIMACSPTQPVLDTTAGKFGPYAGQVFVGEMNTARLMRVLTEEVGGGFQGACLPFYDRGALSAGNHRMVFDQQGGLYIGHTALSWAGGKGIQRMTWKGTAPFDLLGISLTKDGFALRFTKPVAAAAVTPESYSFRRYYYEYHETYGCDTLDVKPVAVTAATADKDGTGVALTLAELKPGYIYELTMKGVTASDGEAVANTLVCYTINHLRDGTPAPAQIPGTGPEKAEKKKKQ